ncbi:MAG: hypothetical protein WCG97_00910 [bacterium]
MSSAEATIEEMAGVEDARLADQKIKAKVAAAGVIKDDDPDLPWGTFFLMLILAIIFDVGCFLMNLIPIAGGFLEDVTITPAAILSFWIWFKMKGIKFTKGSRGLVTVIVGIVGFIPVLNAFPKWTCEIIYMKIAISGGKKLKQIVGK